MGSPSAAATRAISASSCRCVSRPGPLLRPTVRAARNRAPLLLELRHRGFRNLEDARFAPARGATLLVGDNGSGKTSLLEAAYVAATTKSFRATQLVECVRRQASEFHLAAEVAGSSGERFHLAVSIGPGSERARFLNSKPSSLAEHLGAQPVVSWTTAERTLLVGPPAARRRFLDRGLVAERPAALDALSRYHRALEQKRALLAARKARELEPWNELLATTGVELAGQRAAHVERLRHELAGVLAAADHPFPPIEMRYRPNPPAALEGAAAFSLALDAARSEEIRRRQPVVGPHRDDLEILWAGVSLRGVASAGERKALGLALLAAQLRVLEQRGRPPLVLLDDADVELDRHALERSWRLFAGRQVLASSNRPEVWVGLEIDRIERLSHGTRTVLE